MGPQSHLLTSQQCPTALGRWGRQEDEKCLWKGHHSRAMLITETEQIMRAQNANRHEAQQGRRSGYTELLGGAGLCCHLVTGWGLLQGCLGHYGLSCTHTASGHRDCASWDLLEAPTSA